jgi:alkanesulfonate monooxygenase SsuD/methylene tetrahydromethanopterin reductase-like flavin-dependent oxidoreductase (luciferase family)
MSEADAAYVADSFASHFIGSPSRVGQGLRELVERTAADEIMVSTRIFDLDARKRSLSLLASEWRLEGIDVGLRGFSRVS